MLHLGFYPKNLTMTTDGGVSAMLTVQAQFGSISDGLSLVNAVNNQSDSFGSMPFSETLASFSNKNTIEDKISPENLPAKKDKIESADKNEKVSEDDEEIERTDESGKDKDAVVDINIIEQIASSGELADSAQSEVVLETNTETADKDVIAGSVGVEEIAASSIEQENVKTEDSNKTLKEQSLDKIASKNNEEPTGEVKNGETKQMPLNEDVAAEKKLSNKDGATLKDEDKAMISAAVKEAEKNFKNTNNETNQNNSGNSNKKDEKPVVSKTKEKTVRIEVVQKPAEANTTNIETTETRISSGKETEIIVNVKSEAHNFADKNSAPRPAVNLENFLQRELHQNLNGDIVRQADLQLKSGGDATIRLSLKPESLGNVKIHLEMSENKVTGKIIVESQEALRAFEEEIGNLEQAFRDSGFDGANLEMSFNGGEQKNNDANNSFSFFSESDSAMRYSVELSEYEHRDNQVNVLV
jgi:flagellar hook-length control protein FliK